MEHLTDLFLRKDLLSAARLSESEAKELFFEADTETGDLKIRPDWSANYVDKINARLKEERGNKLGQGKRETLTEVEAKLKPLFDLLGVEMPEQNLYAGLESLTETVKKVSSGKRQLTELTDDEVRDHAAFRKALNKELELERAERERLKSEHEAYKASIEAEKQDQEWFNSVVGSLEGQKAAYGEDRNHQLDVFYKSLNRKLFSKNSESGIDLYDDEGNVVRGPDRMPLTFDEYIRLMWKKAGHGFNEATPAPPSPGRPGEKTTSFTSSAQVQEAIRTEKDPNRKRELMAKASELLRSGK